MRIKYLTLVLVSSVFCVHGQTLLTTASVQLNPSTDGYSRQLPTWSGGMLLVVEKDGTSTPVIHSFDLSGAEITPIVLTIPGWEAIHIAGIARGADGAYAIIGRAVNQDRPGAGFITCVSPDRQTVKTVQPYPYVPHMVTIARDGSVWTVGAETVNGVENNPAVNKSHGLVRHFDTNGTQIGSFIPRSEVFHGKWLGLPQGDLVSNGDRIGWYARLAQQYTELTSDGKVTTYPGIVPPESNPYVFGLALFDNGDVIASVPVGRSGEQKPSLYRLDRFRGVWKAIATPANAMPSIRGSDGKQLVLKGAAQGIYQLVAVSDGGL